MDWKKCDYSRLKDVVYLASRRVWELIRPDFVISEPFLGEAERNRTGLSPATSHF